MKRFCYMLLFISIIFITIPVAAEEDRKALSQATSETPDNDKKQVTGVKDKKTSAYRLDDMVVKEHTEDRFVQYGNIKTASQSIIPRKTIDLMAGPAQTNPFKALDLLPSVHSENSDAYGLINDQNNIRIRGQYGDTFSRLSRTVEGIPLSANVGAGFMGSPIDLENLSEISLIVGAVPVDKGFGYGNAAGAIDQSIRWSSDKLMTTFRQSNGSESFNRTFLRFESGQLSTKTSLFASASYTTADKWRGPGDGNRKNVSFGITQMFPAELQISFFGAYNELTQDEYRSLTYLQAMDHTFYEYDYNPSLTGDALNDTKYYGYNSQEFDQYVAMLLVEYKPTENSYLTFKPHYYKADGVRLAGSGTTTANAQVSINHIIQDQRGFLAEYGIDIGSTTTAKLGYYYMSMNTMPPAGEQKNYALSGSSLLFRSWAYIVDVGDRTFNEPYLMLNNSFGKLNMDVGIKHVTFGIPSITGYSKTGAPDVSVHEVKSYVTPLPNVSAGSADLKEWLPYIGFNYEINKEINARLVYGRNYASPWTGPIYQIYNSNSAAFLVAGISLDDFWKELKLETSDNIDLSIRYDRGSWYILPNLFYGRFKNKQVPGVYDPRVGISYYQDNAEAESMGIELETGISPISGLNIFGAASYNKFTFTENIRTKTDTIILCDGEQVADTPKYMAKIGASYTIKGITFTPVFRYIGKRYGDTLDQLSIDSYNMMDINIDYTLNDVWGFKEMSFGLSFMNIFDEKYISNIKNYQDTSTAMETVYFPGAPFTAVASVGFKF